MTIAISQFASRHIDAVLGLQQQTPEAPRWERRVYEELAQIGSIGFGLIAEEGDALLGFAFLRVVLDICELESIAVSAVTRRRGIGAMLLTAAANLARERGARRMELEVRAGNAAAIGFYIRMGFTQDGLRRGYYSHPEEDAVLMSREISPS